MSQTQLKNDIDESLTMDENKPTSDVQSINDVTNGISKDKQLNGLNGSSNGSVKPDAAGRMQANQFKPGQSGNPKGRQKGSRNKLADQFIMDLHDLWKRKGMQVLEIVADKEPSKLLGAMVQVLPKDFQVSVDIDQIQWVINAGPSLDTDTWLEKHNLIEHELSTGESDKNDQ